MKNYHFNNHFEFIRGKDIQQWGDLHFFVPVKVNTFQVWFSHVILSCSVRDAPQPHLIPAMTVEHSVHLMPVAPGFLSHHGGGYLWDSTLQTLRSAGDLTILGQISTKRIWKTMKRCLSLVIHGGNSEHLCPLVHIPQLLLGIANSIIHLCIGFSSSLFQSA
jgi:hypothetical protein